MKGLQNCSTRSASRRIRGQPVGRHPTSRVVERGLHHPHRTEPGRQGARQDLEYLGRIVPVNVRNGHRRGEPGGVGENADDIAVARHQPDTGVRCERHVGHPRISANSGRSGVGAVNVPACRVATQRSMRPVEVVLCNLVARPGRAWQAGRASGWIRTRGWGREPPLVGLSGSSVPGLWPMFLPVAAAALPAARTGRCDRPACWRSTCAGR
jgi:hypothetical protein